MKRNHISSTKSAWRLAVGGLFSLALFAGGCDTAPTAQVSNEVVETESSVNAQAAQPSTDELAAAACGQARAACEASGVYSEACSNLGSVCDQPLAVTCSPTDCVDGDDCGCPALEALGECFAEFGECMGDCSDDQCLQKLGCVAEMIGCVAEAVTCPGGECPEGGCPDGECPGDDSDGNDTDGKCPEGGCPDGECPEGGCPDGCPDCPDGKCPEGGCPEGCPDCPEGGCPEGCPDCPEGGCPNGDCPGCPDGACPGGSCPGGSCPGGSCG